MSVLLDTHAALWVWGEPEKLSSAARERLTFPGTTIWVSAVTAWEIALKVGQGRLEFVPARFPLMMESFGFQHLPITARHAIVAGALPRAHGDPFDRMLVAQAQVENLVLLTADAAISRYNVATFPAR